MSRLMSLSFVLTLVFVATESVPTTSSQICAWYDSQCLTKATIRIYEHLVHGMKDLFKPIDPMYVPYVGGHVESFEYELTNITMTGMRNCKVELLKFNNADKKSYEYNLYCPQLVLDFNYTSKGKLADVEFDETEGQGSITTDDYLILMNGTGEYIMSEQGKLRYTLKKFEVDTVLGGKMLLVNKSFTQGDKAKIDFAFEYLNKQGAKYEPYFRTQVLRNFMVIYAQTVDTYLGAFPIEEIFKKE